ncbi:MAG: hypothetical protein WDO73_22525 [Ignavibacteriota bacterium]
MASRNGLGSTKYLLLFLYVTEADSPGSVLLRRRLAPIRADRVEQTLKET